MGNKQKFSDSQWLQRRYAEADEIVPNWRQHSRQTESRNYDILFYLPDDVLEFVRKRVQVVWKRGKQVAAMVPPQETSKRYLIILDTKLENQSMDVCRAIFALKIAEAYLSANPRLKATREELVKSWDIDLGVLEGEHAWGFEY